MSETTDDQIEEAVSEGKVDLARKLLTKHPEYIGRYYSDVTSWLKMAAETSQLDMVKLLLELGCDVNAGRKESAFETPLWSAIGEDNPEIVKLLLEHGADPNRHKTVISAIAGPKRNSLEMVKLLEKHGADLHRNYINELTNQPMNALSTAVDWGKDDVAEYLRSKGAVMPVAGKAAISKKKTPPR